MRNAMVAARVPAEIRDQGNEALKRMGSTPTQLINAAYEYVVATGTLPAVTVPPRAEQPALSTEELRALEESLTETTFSVPESYFAGRSYKDILQEELKEDYETLS